MHNNKQIAAAVIIKENKILLAQRGGNNELHGKWEFPGGKVEQGETLQDCLKREMYEELGIVVSVGKYLCTSSFIHKGITYDMNMFLVETYSGQITLKEHLDYAWVFVKDLHTYEMPEPDLPIVQYLQTQYSKKD